MDILVTTLMSALLLSAALGLIYWHLSSWKSRQSSDLTPEDHDFYRRQYRRRMQSSGMLGILAVGLFLGEYFTRWIDSPLFFIVYWGIMLLIVVWMAMLAVGDMWTTKYYFGKMRDKCLIEQAKLHAEIRRVQSHHGNGDGKFLE
jgi:hypothetical protein